MEDLSKIRFTLEKYLNPHQGIERYKVDGRITKYGLNTLKEESDNRFNNY